MGGFICFRGTILNFPGILAFYLFPFLAYLAPCLTLLFSSDTPDYSRLPFAALIFFFLLLQRYFKEGMSQFEVFSSVVAAFTTEAYVHGHLHAYSHRDRPGGVSFPYLHKMDRIHVQWGGNDYMKFFGILPYLHSAA